MAEQELLASIRDRYRTSSKKDKSRIPDGFIAVRGHHRKHGIRLLGQSAAAEEQMPGVKSRRIYDEAVREAVIVVWESIRPDLRKASEAGVTSPGGVHLTTRTSGPGRRSSRAVAVRQRCHLGSAAQTHQVHRTQPTESEPRSPHPRSDLRRLGRPFTGIPGNRPGGPLRGQHGRFVHPQRGDHRHLHGMDGGRSPSSQGAIPGDRGLEAIAARLPVLVLGIDSDNDGTFINETLNRSQGGMCILRECQWPQGTIFSV